MPFKKLKRKFREVERGREVVNVLLKHGFGYFLERLDIEKIPFKERIKVPKEKILIPVRVKKVLEELGPTFIKFGQVMSMRPDLIPEEFILELEKLQDRVSPFSYEEVEIQIRQELGKDIVNIFASFGREPFAAASIGQVHNAELITGESVVVKVQRPDIAEVIEADIDILFSIAQLAEKHITESRRYDPVGLVEEFAKSIRKELDYSIEGRNADRFANNFKGEHDVHIPHIYWEYSGRRVLTMEKVRGRKISELQLEVYGKEAMERISETVLRAYMKQILHDGFFHADPHPGNLFIMKNGVLAFTDFGMVGRIDDHTRDKLASLFTAIIRRDIETVVDELLDIGLIGEDTDTSVFREDIEELIGEYYGTSLNQVELSQMLDEVTQVATKHHVRMPPNFALLIKAIVTMEALCRELNPDFNLTELSKPYVEDLILEKYHPKRLMGKFMNGVAEFNKVIIDVPRLMARTMRKLQRGEITIDIQHEGLHEVTSEVDAASNRISMSLIISALIVGSSVIMLTGQGPLMFGFPVIGIIGYMIAGVLGFALVINILRTGHF